jgi:transcriptional regulator with XRE-family HTH domain
VLPLVSFVCGCPESCTQSRSGAYLNWPGTLKSLAMEFEMVIAERLRALREQKQLSQGDIENRTGLLRCYISRVENGHTLPSIETLEKIARALQVPIYQIFYDGEKPPAIRPLKIREGWGSTGHDARTLERFRRLLQRTSVSDLKLLMFMAQRMSQNSRRADAKKRRVT